MNKRFLKIYIEITNSCNFNCSFCKKSNRTLKSLSIDEFKIIINEVKEYTDLITLHVKGEPLLHPNLNEILDIVKDANLKVNITTNGSLIKKNIEALKVSCLRQLNLSIHSVNEDSENKINKETYLEDIFEAVKILRENSKELYISYRLWNLKDISENSENYNLICALEKEYKINNLINLAKENSFVALDEKVFLNQDLEFEWPSINDDVIGCIGRCYGLRNQIAILSNGDVVPCCLDQDGIINLGNIFKTSLNEILNSEKSLKIIKGFEENKIVEELCKRCSFREKFSK